MDEKDVIIRSLEAKNTEKEALYNNLRIQMIKLNSYKKTTNDTLEEKGKMQVKINNLEAEIYARDRLKENIGSLESQICAKRKQLKLMEQNENEIRSKNNNKMKKKIQDLERKLKGVRSVKGIDDDIQSIEKVQIQKIIIPEITIVDNEPEEPEQSSEITVSEFQFDSENAASNPKKLKTEIKSEEK